MTTLYTNYEAIKQVLSLQLTTFDTKPAKEYKVAQLLSYRALFASFANELGTSGEQIDSFWKSHLNWVFTEKFTHTF